MISDIYKSVFYHCVHFSIFKNMLGNGKQLIERNYVFEPCSGSASKTNINMFNAHNMSKVLLSFSNLNAHQRWPIHV